jgi:predicted RND superfamily exporter protein
MENVIERLKTLNRTTWALMVGAVATILIVVVLLIVFSGSGDVTISVETSLKEMITSSQLRTAEYTYNSIAEVKDGDNTKYYVSYNGTVSAGFDFEKVQIVRDGKVIQIIVPDVQILEVIVDPELDYIFIKDKYDTEQTYAEATEACKEDLWVKAQTNETLLKTARESAEDTLEALIKPFESQLSEGESFEIVFDTEKEVDE